MNELPEIRIDAVHRVVDDGEHNAFTDLTRFQGRYYLTFRSCPDGHMLFNTSRIRVLVSDDGVSGWTPVLEFGLPPHRDVRDPHLLVFDDQLFVYTGAWLVPTGQRPRDCNDHLGFAAWTENGVDWEGPRMLEGTYGHYIWRAAAHDGTAWLCGRRRRDFAPLPEGGEDRRFLEGALLESEDGLTWRTASLCTEDYGNETAFAVDDEGALWALARGAEGVPARLCRATAPYDRWQRHSLDQDVGGPLLARWGDRWLVGGRRMTDRENPKTVLWWLAPPAGDGATAGGTAPAGGLSRLGLHEAAELPSGGDTSYPGFVALDGEHGLLSFYSSHEGSGKGLPPCHIYVAEISIA